MIPEPELIATTIRPQRLRRDLRACTVDGAAFSVMVGTGETYLPAFALAVGMGEVAAGLVASVPMLAGGVLQLVTPAGVRRLGSLRRWVVLCATVQALSFVPLILFALAGRAPAWAVYLAATVYWGAGLATSPAWNTWMERMVPRRIRVRYFARRTRLAHALLLVGLLTGGLTLHGWASTPAKVAAFAVLFGLAAASRFVSAGFLAAQTEPPQDLDRHRLVTARQLLTQGRHASNARLVAYLLVLQAAAQLAGPYFTPFMLGQLHLSYSAYMTVLATSFLAKSLALPVLGRLASRIGALRLLWVGGLAIAPLPALWVISHSVPYLLFLQVLGGLAWGAHELAMFLLFFETIPEDERTGVLTTFNLLNSAAFVAGSVIGGAWLRSAGADPTAYHQLFVVSSTLRVVALVLLVRVLAATTRVRLLTLRTLAVRPSLGSIDRPILSSIPEAPGASSTPNGAPI